MDYSATHVILVQLYHRGQRLTYTIQGRFRDPTPKEEAMHCREKQCWKVFQPCNPREDVQFFFSEEEIQRVLYREEE